MCGSHHLHRKLLEHHWSTHPPKSFRHKKIWNLHLSLCANLQLDKHSPTDPTGHHFTNEDEQSELWNLVVLQGAGTTFLSHAKSLRNLRVLKGTMLGPVSTTFYNINELQPLVSLSISTCMPCMLLPEMSNPIQSNAGHTSHTRSRADRGSMRDHVLYPAGRSKVEGQIITKSVQALSAVIPL